MVILSHTRHLFLVCLLCLLSACAQNPRVQQFDPNAGKPEGDWPLWPKPPEIPRFAYAGELTGEKNFKDVETGERSTPRRFFAWLVGLGLEQRLPVVLQRPQGVISDGQGRIFVSDVSRQAVYVFDKTGGQLLVWERATPEEGFIAPIGMALGEQGELYVSDAELGFVAVLGRDGTPERTLGKGLLQRPTGIARDEANGRVYVADTRANDIKIFDGSGLLLDTLGNEGDSLGELNAPTYLAFAEGRLYVTDTLNSRIQVFDDEGNLLRHFGERGLYIGNLARPKGISVDPDGNVFVIESYYDHLLMYDNQGRLLLPIGGTGHEPGQFYLPAGVWADKDGQVYVADMFNGRVAIFQFLGGTP